MVVAVHLFVPLGLGNAPAPSLYAVTGDLLVSRRKGHGGARSMMSCCTLMKPYVRLDSRRT